MGTERSLERMSRPPCEDREAAVANPDLTNLPHGRIAELPSKPRGRPMLGR